MTLPTKPTLEKLRRLYKALDAAKVIAAQFEHRNEEAWGGLQDTFIDPFSKKEVANGTTIPVADLRALSQALKELE